MWIILRLFLFFIARFYKKNQFLYGNQEFQKSSDGTHYIFVTRKRNKKEYVNEVIVKTKASFFFKISKETKILKFLKKIGFDGEIQTGDQGFDEKFFIASDNLSVQSSLKNEGKLRNLIYDLELCGLKEVLSDGNGHIRFISDEVTLDKEEYLRRCLDVSKIIDEVIPSKREVDKFVRKIIFLEFILYGLLGYALGSYLHFKIDDGQIHLDPFNLLIKGVFLGLILIFFGSLIIYALFRKSSRASLIISEYTIFYLISSIVAGPQMIFDLNQALDRSRPVIIESFVERKFSRTTGSRKNRSTAYYVKLRFLTNPFQMENTLRVSPMEYFSIIEKGGLDFFIKKGFFNSPYRERMESVPVSSKFYNPQQFNRNKIIPESELKELMNWTSDSIEFAFESSRTEKYPNGKIKQIEYYKNNLKQGLASYWHANGNLYGKIPWFNGEKHGRFDLFRDDGTLEQSLSYRNGKPHGLLKWYNEKGNLKQQAIYRDGEHIQVVSERLEKLLKY